MVMSFLPVNIEDVTAVTDIETEIPLEKFVEENEEAEFELEHCDGVVFRMKEPRVTALVFPSGKIICTGSKSIQQAKESLDRIVERVGKLGIDVPDDPQIEIEKIVAAFKMTKPFDLKKISESLEGSVYDPEKFPGLVYMTTDPPSEFLIRENGKIICTGSNSIKDIQASMKDLQKKLEKAGIKAHFVED